MSFKRVCSLLSFWWVLSSADTKFFPTKVQNSFKLFCLCVCFLSLSLSGAFSVSYIELSGGIFNFPFLWSLMGIVSLILCFDFSSKFLFFCNVLIFSLLFWGGDLFYCYKCGS
jgi:hypothetical protein